MRNAALALVLLAACFDPKLGDKPFLCGADNLCPPGYRCGAGTCVPEGSGVAVDAGRADARGDGGATVCQANDVVCVGNVAHKCRSDGSGFDDTTCALAAGEICFPGTGCVTLCGGGGTGRTEGCEFVPTAAGNAEALSGFAIVVLNGNDAVARVRIDGGGLDSPRFRTVPARGALVEPLPWVDALASCVAASCTVFAGTSVLANGGAYRVVSTLPVSVLQYSPVGPSGSADASRLLPVRSQGKDYMVAVAPPANGWPSFLAVTGSSAGTSVTVRPRVNMLGGSGVQPIAAGGSRTFSLGVRDVLMLYSTDDITGSELTSDKPVQVISGNTCAAFEDLQACSHTEEAMLPRPALFYQALAPALPGLVYQLRVVAADGPTSLEVSDGTTVQTALIAARGQYHDFAVGEGFLKSVLVSSKEKTNLLVVQTIIGAPAMTIYRPLTDKVSLVQAPAWGTRAMAIYAKSGDAVTVDGRVLPGTPTPIALSGYVLWLTVIGDGLHVVQTPNEAAVTVIASEPGATVATFWY